MDTLRAMRLFVRLVETGSFTRLAEEKNLSKSMISKEISRLEDSLGARLLQRSTRSLTLTEIGEGYLTRCREVLLKIEDAEGYVQDFQQHPKGRLKINAPMALGLTDLDRLFADFMVEYPDIELDIHLSDESVDLVEQGFDIGFRASSTQLDSSYIGRPLMAFNYHLCVSTDYFSHHPAINHEQDLKQHNCFVYRNFSSGNRWPLGDGVDITGSLTVNSTPFMLNAIRKGLGIGFLPDFVCRNELDKGLMQEILADVSRPKLTLYALYPARQHVPPKITHCLNFFERWFAQRSG